MGILLGPYEGLEELVASSAKFRTITGAANATAALDKIHYPYPEDDSERPWALIDNGAGTEWEDVIRFSAGGALMLTIEVPKSSYTTPTTHKGKFKSFMSDADTVIAQMAANSNVQKGDGSNYWNLTSVSKAEGPGPVDPEDGEVDAPYYTCSFLCRWV